MHQIFIETRRKFYITNIIVITYILYFSEEYLLSSKMRFLTPEIAWHETLPIYSCDLQNRLKLISDNNNNKCSNQTSSRSPLSELNFKNVKDLDPDLNWTRLATAGGDNVVRLWRVQLNWLPGVLKTTTKQTESQCTTNLTVAKKDPGVNTPGTTQKTDSKQFEHLTYLASLKRHEKPVNVVRWSPSGKVFVYTIH